MLTPGTALYIYNTERKISGTLWETQSGESNVVYAMENNGQTLS